MLSATVCFKDDFADARLSCQAPTEGELCTSVKTLITDCGLRPQQAWAREGGKTRFVVMACYDGDVLDADLTRRVQFAIFDWRPMLFAKLPWHDLEPSVPHKHGASWLTNRKKKPIQKDEI